MLTMKLSNSDKRKLMKKASPIIQIYKPTTTEELVQRRRDKVRKQNELYNKKMKAIFDRVMSQ